MYYSSGNYEAFARPRKPEVENKTAWFVGSGLASLAGAAFLIRDGQMAGDRITILEELNLPGGALDGIRGARKGLRDSRRSRDGGPFRVPVGPVPLDPFAGDRRRERARRILLAQQE